MHELTEHRADLATNAPGMADPRGRHVAAPDAERMNQLVPRHVAGVIAAAGRPSDDRSAVRRARDAAGTLALIGESSFRHTRRASVAPAIDEIVGSVSSLLPGRVAAVTVLSGPPRPNRKPVLQLLDRVGRPMAFVKVGTNELTAPLIDHEAAVLATLADSLPTTVAVPRVIAHRSEHARSWLALSPVSVPGGTIRRVTDRIDRTDSVARAIEAVGGIVPRRLGASAFVERLRAAADGDADVAALADSLVARHGDTEVGLGAWHGDFVPWNIRTGRGATAVWDWERFETGVPGGLDRLHLRLQVAIQRRGVNLTTALDRLRHGLDTTLPDMPPAARAATFDTYIAALAARYLHDSALSGDQRTLRWGTTLRDRLTTIRGTR